MGLIQGSNILENGGKYWKMLGNCAKLVENGEKYCEIVKNALKNRQQILNLSFLGFVI